MIGFFPALLAASVLVTVGAGDWERYDKPVEIRLMRPGPIRVVEIGGQAVASQLDPDGTLTFLMPGVTPAGATRRFRVLFQEPAATQPEVTVEEVPAYQGQDSFRIATPSGVYYYHKAGAGFASLLDADGNDWISYRPEGGSDGKYRGIPNLIHPEGEFHPGGLNSTTEVRSGLVKAALRSETRDGAWAGRWDIFPHYARFTVLRAPRPYWFLYEGTPGGSLDLDRDYWIRSGGTKLPITESWSGVLPSPKWVAFGDGSLARLLYLVRHDDSEALDQFWQMDGNMTVFGFGRQYRCCQKYLTTVPAQFTVGFAETTDVGQLVKHVHSAFQPLLVTTIEERAPEQP
jgi:hypothetical protein